MKKIRILLAASLILSASNLIAQPLQPTDIGSGEPDLQPGLDAKTVFVPKTGNRKEDSAAAITAMHQKMAAQGWTVIDVDTYIENGDQWGFFITYVKQEHEWNATK